MARIALAGFQHETNSFSPVPADFDAFSRATSWPGLTVGVPVLVAVRGMNLAIAGFEQAATRAGHEVVPLVWANATPSGPVTADAFERIMAILLRQLRELGPWDAVFLDLHGAMIVEHHLDGEGEILRRVRAEIGPRPPLVASLDLHANVSPAMMNGADVLLPCRTYPHVDLAETGRRAYTALATCLSLRRADATIYKAYRQPDFLIPIQAQTTHLQPAQALYEQSAALCEQFGLLELGLTLGFGPSDTPHCGPAVTAIGTDPVAVERAADALHGALSQARKHFSQPVWTADDAVKHAMDISSEPGAPIVLADLQDNPGAGGTGDTTGLLKALSERGATGCVLAVLYDPASARQAHALGEGTLGRFSLGGKCGGPGSVPFDTDAKVIKLGTGQFLATGPMYGGASMDLGPMALLELPSGVRVILGSVNTHTADQSILRHLDVEPAHQRIVALKSAVHFRADFQPIARKILVVASPGVNAADLTQYPYRHLRPGLALMP